MLPHTGIFVKLDTCCYFAVVFIESNSIDENPKLVGYI